MRPDLGIIMEWIAAGSRVLDLGCGDGTLLAELTRQKGVHGWGIENNPHDISHCIAQGVNVIEHDLDQGLAEFRTQRFDTVVMSLALQAVRFPDLILDEMLQIGRECIVTFPNFGHWSCRHDIGLRGRMPRSDFLPHEWYNTPNIHFCTIADFEALCRKKNFQILNQRVVDRHYRSDPLMRRWPNLLAEIAIYRLTR